MEKDVEEEMAVRDVEEAEGEGLRVGGSDWEEEEDFLLRRGGGGGGRACIPLDSSLSLEIEMVDGGQTATRQFDLSSPLLSPPLPQGHPQAPCPGQQSSLELLFGRRGFFGACKISPACFYCEGFKGQVGFIKETNSDTTRRTTRPASILHLFCSSSNRGRNII